MKPATVHYIGNRSTYDEIGRLRLFLVNTFCGRLLAKPLLVTDNADAVTCGRCLRSIGIIYGAKKP